MQIQIRLLLHFLGVRIHGVITVSTVLLISDSDVIADTEISTSCPASPVEPDRSGQWSKSQSSSQNESRSVAAFVLNDLRFEAKPPKLGSACIPTQSDKSMLIA